jgi:hypothetical protein
LRKHRSLFGRPLTHPDIAHVEALIEDRRRSCKAIDKHYERFFKNKTSVGAHAGVREKAPRYEATLHDIAANNPILRDMLRKMQ